jgi:hypothetical protein
MLLRSGNRRALDLADCFLVHMPNEGTKGSRAEHTKVLTVLMNQGKTNQHARMEYGAAIRHREPQCCLIGSLAAWFFWRWQVENEAFPDFTNSDNWYDIKVIRQSKAAPTQEVSYETVNLHTKALYEAAGIAGSKTTHLPRIAGAQNADMLGVNEAYVSYLLPLIVFPQFCTHPKKKYTIRISCFSSIPETRSLIYTI